MTLYQSPPPQQPPAQETPTPAPTIPIAPVAPATPQQPVAQPTQQLIPVSTSSKDLVEQNQKSLSTNDAVAAPTANIIVGTKQINYAPAFYGNWATNSYGNIKCDKAALEARIDANRSGGSAYTSSTDVRGSIVFRVPLGGRKNCEERLQAASRRDEVKNTAKLTQLCFQMAKQGLDVEASVSCRGLGIRINRVAHAHPPAPLRQAPPPPIQVVNTPAPVETPPPPVRGLW